MVIKQAEPEAAPTQQAVTLSSLQQQQLMDLARAVGVDPNHLVQTILNIRLTEGSGGRPGFLSELPSSTTEQMRATDLGMSILSRAFGEGRQADFSLENIVGGVLDYERTRSATFAPTHAYIGEQTETGLRREARRIGVDGDTLVNTVRVYCMLSDLNPQMGQLALRMASGGDARVEAMARAYQSSIQRTEHEDGRTEYWISRDDKQAILASYSRERLQHARISRMSEGERVLRERVIGWGGDFNQVRRYMDQLMRGRFTISVGPQQERDANIAEAVVRMMRRNNLTMQDLTRWDELSREVRGDFISQLPLAYRPSRAPSRMA